MHPRLTSEPASDPTVEVRPADPSQYCDIGELCVGAYIAGGHLTSGDPYEETLRNVAGRDLGGTVLVAMRDGLLVGTATICNPGSPCSEVSRAGEAEFRFLAVAPIAWGTGVGEAIVATLHERARREGASAMVICVMALNEAGHRFYTRLGYQRLPERDWSPSPHVQLQAYAYELRTR
ncbi:MAG: GNAT family N-acetyltransferase [Actinomycetales bacterium]